MKQFFIFIAKIFMICVWSVILVNLVHPFPGSMSIALNVMAIFMLFMHGLQVLMLTKLSGGKIELSKTEKLSIWVFGSFAMFGLKEKILNTLEQKK